jgi:hypothetical protein
MAPVREASPEISALDAQIRHHLRRRTGPIARFLYEWLRQDEVRATFMKARGIEGESYFQYLIAVGDTEMAFAVVEMCAMMADSRARDAVLQFLKTEDNDGNGVWHYLSARLGADPDAAEWRGLVFNLAQFKVGVRHVNARGESALAGMLLPAPCWEAVNALIDAQLPSLELLEYSLETMAGGNREIRSHLLGGLLIADVNHNQARLCGIIVQQAADGLATREMRAAAVRSLFQFVAGDRGETAFLKIAESGAPELMERLLAILQAHAADEAAHLVASDLAAAKVHQQIVLYGFVSRANRLSHGPLMKAVLGNRPMFIERLSRVFRNDELFTTPRGIATGARREPIVVDAASAAPSNPWLSLLLQQDTMGNTPLHMAALWGRIDCFNRLIAGLSMVDLNLLLRGVPNRVNLSVMDMSLPAAAQAKMAAEVLAKRANPDSVKTILGVIEKNHAVTRDVLADTARRAADGASKATTGPGGATRAGFDINRVPSVIYLKQAGAA